MTVCSGTARLARPLAEPQPGSMIGRRNAMKQQVPTSFKTRAARAGDKHAMIFSYDKSVASQFPDLVTGLLAVRLPQKPLEVVTQVDDYEALALARVTERVESEWPAVRAWRAAFSAMGMKPTQYRCASEALLRRLRKEGKLPRLNPLVNLCNAVSTLYGIPIAVFDLAEVSGDLTVRPARGDEIYSAFNGTVESPAEGEIIFADATGCAHARRWTNRQSAASAVTPKTRTALIVIEGLHRDAQQDVIGARETIATALLAHDSTLDRDLLMGAQGLSTVNEASS